MYGAHDAFWAKKQDKDGNFLWLSLAQHLLDTAHVASFLWHHWLDKSLRQFLAQSLCDPDEEKARKLVVFLAAIHDLGKATPAFQTMLGYTHSPDLTLFLMERLERSGFTGIRSLVLPSARSTHHALAGEYLLSTYHVSDDIAAIVGGHHGKPIDDLETCKMQQSYPSNYFQVEKPHDPLYQKWDSEQRNIFKWALAFSGFKSAEELPSISKPAQVLFSGLLIMADWLASNEQYFPLLPLDVVEVPHQEERQIKAFDRWNKTEVWQAEDPSSVNAAYHARFGFDDVRSVQDIFYKTIENTRNPGIFILEAPMGVGKTEAALIGAEQLAYKTGKSGMFFGLPTQATSNGMFPRIRDWLDSVSQAFGGNTQIRLLHGKAALNKDYLEVKKRSASHIDPDGSEYAGAIVNEWFSGRKSAILDDFIVGTVDQLLMLALKQRHLALRHLGFSKKVVIIDEVHAYDAYMNQYLLEAIRWLGSYEIPVIIMSATLPIKRREELLRNYLQGKGLKWKKDVVKPEGGLYTDAYPLITYSDGNAVKQITTFEREKSKTVTVIKCGVDQEKEILSRVIRQDGVIGIVVNTVKRAQNIAEMCGHYVDEDSVILIHSNFIATERAKKEETLLSLIGHNAKRPKKLIVVGTQVLEQSLDIDFDVMVTDLAPMDLLIQRIGRLHRHEIERPSQHREARVYVMGFSGALDFEEGSQFIYGRYLLFRTQLLLPSKILLPDDISPLVQKVYASDDSFIPESLQDQYLEMKVQFNTDLDRKETKARTYRIASPISIISKSSQHSLIGWLRNPTANESEERACAQVRDTQDTIEVIALKKTGGGYGTFADDRDISDEIEDSTTAQQIATQTLRLPLALSKPYNIDNTIMELEKYNRQYLSRWQNLPWLHGQLGIIFDENGQFVLNGFILHYEMSGGLTYERINRDESI